MCSPRGIRETPPRRAERRTAGPPNRWIAGPPNRWIAGPPNRCTAPCSPRSPDSCRHQAPGTGPAVDHGPASAPAPATAGVYGSVPAMRERPRPETPKPS
ncbi:hypothetical protein FF041_33410 [Streptomyces jumonjinensis]|uniref:Uncharacterized protein n=1 Tax=Streptomyces jumonjinensis TaxID=1945 RepID=A0A646KRC9_STRJU|nr:hypothetical protein [Streptomyces jumonjinensis]